MNTRENDILTKRLVALQDVIRSNEKLPKEKRDHHAVKDAKDRYARIKQWINGKEDPRPQPELPQITFKSQPHKPESIMVIEKTEELYDAWPNLWKKNVGVQGPPEVLKELKQLVLLYRDREKKFQSKSHPTHCVSGVDDLGISWKAYWRLNYTNVAKVRMEVESKIGQKLSDWRTFKIDKVNNRIAGLRR